MAPSRVFVAIDLPAETRRVVETCCWGLAGARWSDPSQLHLTLRFFAAVSPERLQDIADKLATVEAAPFPLSLRGLGVFPLGQARRARVLWAGVAPAASLRALAMAIDAALGPDEDPATRDGFTPHLTLARFRSPPGTPLDRFITANAAFATAPWTVGGFHLYESTLSPDGALHTPLRHYPLGKGL